MHYEKGKGYIDVAGNKVCPKREMQLRLARIAGYENDSSTFTRLRIESRVAYPHLLEAWHKGVTARENGVKASV